MKHTFIAFFLCLALCLPAGARNAGSSRDLELKAGDAELSIDSKGSVSSVKVCGREIITSSGSPLVLALSEGKVLIPVKMETKGTMLNLTMQDGGRIVIEAQQSAECVTLEVREASKKYEAVMLVPVQVSVNAIVGDVIGVVQGNGVAFGMQALNIKTCAGIPQEYAGAVNAKLGYKGEDASVSTSELPAWKLAAVRIAGNGGADRGGAAFQFYCRRRDREEMREVNGVKRALVEPVKGTDAQIAGAKIALFGVSAIAGSEGDAALKRIGEIEVAEGLPHPMMGGEWAKTSRESMRSYLISDFGEDNLDYVLDKCDEGGFKYLYQIDPFRNWGHFGWNPEFVKVDSDSSVKALCDKAAARGIGLGIHTLSNFTTTDDPYVTPKPSRRLLKQGRLQLSADVDASRTELSVSGDKGLFAVPATLNSMQIDDEIIRFGSADTSGSQLLLHNCTRGAFGTAAAPHSRKSPLYKLWDYPYKTLFPDIELQDSLADRLSAIFNATGLRQLSFDGLEGCMYTGQDNYSTARFVSRFYNGLDDKNIINDGSNLNHYMWHIHTRMNWGEPWGESMRTGQVAARIKNQDFFRRNLFPRMLGWFQIRLAGRNDECTSLEDVEWAMSEAAGFDAGFAMTIYMKTMRGHGQIDRILASIKDWVSLRMADCFPDSLKAALRDPQTEWHLESMQGSEQGVAQSFALYPLYISRHFHCDLADMQPGQPGGADWQWDNPYAEGRFALKLRVIVEGGIDNPTLMTAKGTVKFPCKVEAGQYLLYDFESDSASVTDKNFNVISAVKPEGTATLQAGAQSVSFSCGRSDGDPEVDVRYMLRGTPYQVMCPPSLSTDSLVGLPK